MADDAGEKMLTEERLKELKALDEAIGWGVNEARQYRLRYVFHEVLEGYIAQSATIKRLEIPVADGEGQHDLIASDDPLTALELIEEIKTILGNKALSPVVRVVSAQFSITLFKKHQAALSLNSVETREMKR